MRLWVVVGLIVSGVGFGSEDREEREKGRDALASKPIVIPPIAIGYEEFYMRFLRGVLIYRPHLGSDVGRIVLPIMSLANPLEGIFDLSGYGDAGKYISVRTGYKKAKIPANGGKIEIWITPKFLVEANFKGNARWLWGAMREWTHPWGMFWTYGSRDCKGDNFDYLVKSDVLEDKSKNLYARLFSATQRHRSDGGTVDDEFRIHLASTGTQIHHCLFLEFD